MMDEHAQILVVTVFFLTIYLIGIGGTTATAIRVREVWRHRKPDPISLEPRPGEERQLVAPTLPTALRWFHRGGWVAFPIALGLALFANPTYPMLVPLTVVAMVALNAFYVTAMQGIAEPLTLSQDGFTIGERGRQRSVRWIHVTEFAGARVGAFGGTRTSEKGEWQDPKLVANVVFYRLNHALVHSPKTWRQRMSGFSYYDGVIRNEFGIPTEQLLNAMREWQRLALEAEAPPIRRPRPGESMQTRRRDE